MRRFRELIIFAALVFNFLFFASGLLTYRHIHTVAQTMTRTLKEANERVDRANRIIARLKKSCENVEMDHDL